MSLAIKEFPKKHINFPELTKKQRTNMLRLVKALESGAYAQTTNTLIKQGKNFDRFCCLGVACNIYALDHNKEWTFVEAAGFPKGTKIGLFFKQEELPPKSVVKYFGFDGNEGELPVMLQYKIKGKIRESSNLIGLNDHGVSFKKIAKVIRKYYLREDIKIPGFIEIL